MMQTYEYYLADGANLSSAGGIQKRDLLNDAIDRFDSVRAREAGNPRVGVREVKMLMMHSDVLGVNKTYAKVYDILISNLKSDPHHANSMIQLSRLQVAQGARTEALNTLQSAEQHILTRRDGQLIVVETLRQLSAPKVIVELDEIEQQLHQVRSDSETGKASARDTSFYDDIDIKLNKIANLINK